MKRFFTILLALMMIMSLATTVFAADISVTDAKNGETYTAYKIFDVTINTAGTAYAYTIADGSPWEDVISGFTYQDSAAFVLTPSANDPNVLVVTETNKDADYGAALAEYLAGRIPTGAEKTEVVAANNAASFTGLATGYYFVDTTLGSLCSLFTTDSDAVLTEKNTIPSLTKTQSKNTLQIGDEVIYTITVTDAKGTDAAITVHDCMETGLTLVADSFEIKVDNNVVESTNYSIDTTSTHADNCTFEIVFFADYVKSLAENKQIVITYKAILDKDAEIADDTNDNTAWLAYSAQTTQPVTVQIYSYKFDLDKVDSNSTPLSGAKFKLFDAATAGNVIKVVKTSDGNYRVADNTETATAVEEMETDTAGQLTISGLDKKSYWLEETHAPDGYNKLTSREQVDLSNGNKLRGTDANNNKTYGVKVVNQAGTELPSTGGVGTTLFYIIGGLMMVGAVVLLVTKKRMAN